MKIAIGMPTYNDYERINNLLKSIIEVTDYDLSDVKIVVLDDGTPDKNKVEKLKEVCDRYKVDFIKHDKNRGIPAAWNSLTRHFNSEYMILFNDDIRICNKDWLKCFIYFLDNNPKIASIGFPLIQIDVNTGKMRDSVALNYDNNPGRVGSPVGCSFGFRRKAFDEVGGFWEKLRSFYEETMYHFEILEKTGLYSYMIPYPAVEHWGSQTFAKNFELNVQDPIPELPLEEYVEIMLKKYPIERIIPIPGKVYRMDYSRVLFAKKFNCQDYWDMPQVEVHHRLLDGKPAMKVKWLDKNMEEKESDC